MKNFQVHFDVKYEGEVALVEYQEIRCCPIFDIKEATLTRKVCFVEGGHIMDTPSAMTYALVLPRESVRIDLIFTAWSDLDVLSTYVQNEYLNAPPRERDCFKVGP